MKSVKLLVLSVVAAFSSLNAMAENSLKIESATIDDQENKVLKLDLVNDNPLACAFQCDVVLPEGVTVDPSAVTTTDRASSHVVGAAYQTDGSLRVLVYTATLTPFSNTSGAVVNLPLTIASSVAKGDYTATVKNQEISYTDLTYDRPDETSAGLVATAIAGVKAETEEGNSVYSIDGKKMGNGKLKSGVYIKNGKKVSVK